MPARLGLAAVAALLAYGCAAVVDSAPDAGVNDAGVSIGFLTSGAAQLSDAICDYRVRCNGVALERADCLAALSNGPSSFDQPDAIVAAVRAGKVVLNLDQFDDCLRAASALPCFPFQADPLNIEACRAALIGVTKAGEPCTTDFACEDNGSCVATPVDGVCAGRCQARGAAGCVSQSDCDVGEICQLGDCIRANAGAGLDEACGSFVECALGLECVQVNPIDFRCKPLGGDGETCRLDAGIQCRQGLSCVVAAGQREGRCLPFVGRGDTCLETFQCGGPQSPLACDPLSGLCVERPSAGPCLFAGSVAICHPLDAFCDLTRVPPACVRLGQPGDLCRSDVECGPRGENVACVNGRCELIDRVDCVP